MWRLLVEPKCRLGVSLMAAALTFLVMSCCTPMETRIVLAWNVGVLLQLGLLGTMMWRADPQETRRRAQAQEASHVVILLATVITVGGALVAITYGLTQAAGMSRALLAFHTGQSITGVFLAWLWLHTSYVLYYAKIYYNEISYGAARAFQKGLAFPGDSDLVNYWDFMYYSFTIAMCYATSDVTVTSPAMRRLTIVHAIISFIFVLVILGLLVNILANVM